MTTTTFHFIRHMRTQWNEEKRMQGHLDSPLAPEGREKAARWAKKLQRISLDLIVCSDLGRARATAEIFNEQLGLPIIPHQGLREQDWGRWAGFTLEELSEKDRKNLFDMLETGWGFGPPDGETRAQAKDRMFAAMRDIAAEYPGKNILAVSHKAVIKCVLYQLLGKDFIPGEPDEFKERTLNTVIAGENFSLGQLGWKP